MLGKGLLVVLGSPVGYSPYRGIRGEGMVFRGGHIGGSGYWVMGWFWQDVRVTML